MHHNSYYLLIFFCTVISGMDQHATPALELIPKFADTLSMRWPKEQLLALVKKRIEDGHDLNAPIENTTVPPLIFAASNDIYIESIRLLLENGANPEIVHAVKCTPLYQAAFSCAPLSIDALLKKKSDPNNPLYAQSPSKETPLHAACSYYRDSLEKEKNEKRYNAVKLLLDAQANPNAKDRNNIVPIAGLIMHHQRLLSHHLYSGLHSDELKAFLKTREQLINLFFQEKVYLSLSQKELTCLGHESGNPVLLIYTHQKLIKRKNQFKTLLCEYFTGRFKSEAQSNFRKLPSDIIRYIINFAYPSNAQSRSK